MVGRLRVAGRVSARKVENAYAVLVMICTGAAVAKLALQTEVHTSFGRFPAWQFVAGIIGAGLLCALYKLIDKE